MRGAFAALAAAAITLTAIPSPAQTPAAGDARYEAIAKDYFYEGFREAPSNATGQGVHDYDAAIEDVSPAAYGATFRRLHETLAWLKQIDPVTLSPDVAIDRVLLEHQIAENLLYGETRQNWRHQPDLYVSIASDAVYGLIARDFAPAQTRLQDVIARERAIPAMLERSKANITQVSTSAQSIAADDADGAVDLFTQSVPEAFPAISNPGQRAALRASTQGAVRAMRAYAAWIRSLKPSGTFALGAANYAKLLVYEDAITIPIPQLLARARLALAAERETYIATARAIDPAKTPQAVYSEISRNYPAPSRLVAAAQGDLVRIRAFIIAHKIVTLPADADIRAIETPAFARSTTEAAMDAPGPLERVATRAYYWVSPPDPGLSAAEAADYMKQFSEYERPIISIHEIYPGHYTNYIVDKHLPLSLTRRLTDSGSYSEGWAHYDEQMMVDEGWGNGDPRVRLAQSEEALLRNCRWVAGIELHTGGWSTKQAEQLFQTACFQAKAVAAEEALRGTVDPLYGRYTMGKLMILKLRADYARKLGAAYTLQKFHDEFLAHGDLPIPILRAVMLGSDDDKRPL